MEHVNYLAYMKCVFVCTSIFAALAFFRQTSLVPSDELGPIQRHIMKLLVLLIFYNDPFFLLREEIPNHMYYVIQALLSSTFIGY